MEYRVEPAAHLQQTVKEYLFDHGVRVGVVVLDGVVVAPLILKPLRDRVLGLVLATAKSKTQIFQPAGCIMI